MQLPGKIREFCFELVNKKLPVEFEALKPTTIDAER